jgi:hypothetical protein
MAEMLLEQLDKPRILEDGNDPDRRGRPCQNLNGDILFKFGYVLEPMRRSDDKVERGELSKLMQDVKIEERSVRASSKVQRFKVATPDSVKRLREIAAPWQVDVARNSLYGEESG